MRLTTLEIKGFKSFADKTILHFNENITGVVGPNGCGKSNVVDSIRWVLGEQKTSMLRLENMSNLIFNGTKKRKASGLAEVSLTFENTKNILATEFKTITITRRLYRSGDSEYRLNDVPCRLKDIRNLFLDTGVSPDSYAIIELGMVDEILNDRDDSRRKLFEQASGISKYKKRKHETLLKLKGTEADLERVNDLLFEIENNLKSLEKQAKKAKKYFKVKEDYKWYSLELAKVFLYRYKQKYKTLKQYEQTEEDKRIAIETKIKQLDATLEKAKQINLDKEKALAVAQKELNTLIGGVSNKENDRNVLREKLRFEREKNENASKQLVLLEQKAIEVEDKVKEANVRIAEQKKIVKQRQQELQKIKTVLDEIREKHKSLKQQLDADKQAFQEIEKRFYEIEKQYAINNANLDKYKQDLFLFQEESAEKKTALKKEEAVFKTLQKRKETTLRELDHRKTKEQKLQDEKEEVNRQLTQTKDELNKKNRIIDAKQNEYNLTKSLVDSLEGFPESIKFLKKNANWTKNALLVSDIIYCKEAYRIAIENYLEQYLSYYVVNTIDEAIKAVHLLSDASKGRANFFILDEFRHFKPSQPLLTNDLQPVLSLIEVDEPYQQLAAFLLDNTYFINKEEDVENILNNKQYKDINILTASGKFIKHAYAISGGAVGLFEGKRIGRAKNLEKLEKELKAFEKDAVNLKKSILKNQDKLDFITEKQEPELLEKKKAELNQINMEFVSTQARLDNLNTFFASNVQKSKNVSEAIERILVENKAMANEQNSLTQNRESLRQTVTDADSAFVTITDNLNQTSSTFNQNNITFHQEQSKLQNLEQEVNYLTREFKNLKSEQEKNKVRVQSSKNNIVIYAKDLKKTESSLLAGYADKEKIEEDVSTAEQDYYKSKAEINDIDASLKKINYSKQQVHTLIQEIKDKFTDLKIELNALKERLSIEFDVDVNDIINEDVDSNLDEEQLEDKVKKLQAKIDNYGEINPMAVEAYDEMKNRYDFITTQIQDLSKAKETLLETIQEIEDKAKEKFLEAFTEVRTNFQHVFRTLFTEDDKCDLILLNEENPLESKIDIIAKPKGKRPQIIDQLSGGEKTLTATALLFSLYLLKPAPFCIFDEVDAPLDDTNIDKFNKIIQEFSSESQFIIVTHNKQTMSHVDVIYGVTMQEPGVSKVVPVDFRALQEA